MNEVQQLVEQHGSVILLLNTADMSFDVFVPPAKQILEELVALRKEFDEGRIRILGDDIPSEFLEMLKQLLHAGSFSGTDWQIVARVRSLAEHHSSVIILLASPNIEVFVTPNG